MLREEAITVLKGLSDNPLFSDEHKAAFNIAIHDIKQRHDWDINNMILIFKDNYEPIEQEPRWIPVSEKLPNDRNWYLGIFKEPDTGWINPLPFICDYVGRETKATTKEYWILRGFTDWDDYHIDYYFNLECVAWMPLPKAYKAESEG